MVVVLLVKHQGPSVSHLLFADDSFLFFRANTIEGSRALEILNLNERASGQSINFQKSSIFFSSNTRWETRRAVCGMLNVTEALDTRFFLGLPAAVGRDKRAIFGYIKTKVWNRMSGWKSRFFSKAAKEILVKIVAQALQTFLMSVFYLALDLCAKLERMLNSFWWGNGRNGEGVKWMSWERLCVPKCQVGMGFRRLH